MADFKADNPADFSRPKFVIGIDFGTTFSGIAWALEGRENDLEVLQEWPGRGNSTSQKVPTVISYSGKETRWGYQVDDLAEAICGVKLLLDQSQDIDFKPSAASERIMMKLGKKPVEVAGEYLKKIKEHTESTLRRRGLGTLLKTMDVQYILTVPAVWSDKAKDNTKQAAVLAGFPRSQLFLLSEPEAAAVYAISAIQPNCLSVGDCFIVCDAGGGTVDLITYRVTKLDPLRMEEVTEGTGAVCGSMKLDSLFQDLITKRIGQKEFDRMNEAARRITMQRWQNVIKLYYSGPDASDDYLDTGYFVPVPGLKDDAKKHIKDGMTYIESQEVQGIFDPVVKEIENLISSQYKMAEIAGSTPKAIILVGGLGASEYLYKRLTSKFKSMEVMQPTNAWSAVVRGAVSRGLEGNQVDARIARCHYGVKMRTPYDPSIHSRKEAEWDALEERWEVQNQMQWYITKGDTIAENSPISMPFYRAVTSSSSMVFFDSLLFCVNEKAPRSREKNVMSLCELQVDMSKIPKSLFQKCTNSSGQTYYKIHYKLTIKPTSACLHFDFKFNGISYGSVNASYY